MTFSYQLRWFILTESVENQELPHNPKVGTLENIVTLSCHI